MGNILKKLGKIFLVSNFKSCEVLNRTALIVDNGSISKEHLNLTLENTRKSFPYTHIVLLTLEPRRMYVGGAFQDIELKYPSEKIVSRRFQIAVQLFKVRKRNFDYVILTSLDTTLVILAIFFTRAQVLLHNQRNQWWVLRQRTSGDLFKVLELPLWLIFSGIVNTVIFLYLLCSVGLLWLKRPFALNKK